MKNTPKDMGETAPKKVPGNVGSHAPIRICQPAERFGVFVSKSTPRNQPNFHSSVPQRAVRFKEPTWNQHIHDGSMGPTVYLPA